MAVEFNILTEEWFMFDDDKVHPVHEEDILKLSGGGKCFLKDTC